MAVGLVFQFANSSLDDYDRVNKILGLDQKTGAGDWPDGLQSHAAGTTADGSLVVMEVWTSREAQGQFMASRLGPAIQQAGLTVVPTMTWFDIASYHTPGG